MSFSGEESVSSGFSPANSPDEVVSENEYAYSEGTAEDTRSPQDSCCKEWPSKQTKSINIGDSGVPCLLNMAAECVAACHPFEMVERFHHYVKPVPLDLQLDIMKRAFPRDEKLIQSSAFLSRGCSSFSSCCVDMAREADDETVCVRHAVQIGFVLTATIVHKPRYKGDKDRKVSVCLQFDRQRITSAMCSAHRRHHLWCRHIVRLVFYRMRCPLKFVYRLPISYRLEELDIEQHRLIIQNILLEQPLEILSASRKLLDEVVEDGTATVRSDAIPDATAGAGLSEEGMWDVDERRLRKVMRDHCTEQGILQKSCKCSQYEAGIKSLNDWDEKLALPRSRRIVEDDDVEQDSWGDLSEVDVCFQIVRRLLRRGEVLAVTVLCAFTEEWLCMVEDTVKERNTTGTVIDAIASCCLGSISLFTCALESCFLCRLVGYWRLAVMNPLYSKDLVSQMKKQHKSWAKRLDEVVTLSGPLRDRITVLGDCSGGTNYDGQAERARCVKGWNGFRHVQAWASSVARDTIVSLARPMKLSSRGHCTIFNFDASVTGLELATASCFVRCLKFYGCLEQSLELAVEALQCVFCVKLDDTTGTCRSKKVKRKTSLDLAKKLWGEETMSLCWAVTVLLEVVCSLDDAWKIFPDIGQVKTADNASGQVTVQPSLTVSLPVCLCLYFSSVPDDCYNSLYTSLTQIIRANELMDLLLRRSKSCAIGAEFFLEAGRDLCAGMTMVNFNFGRFSHLLLGATAKDNCSYTVRHAVYNLLQIGLNEQARALAGHVDGHGCDNQFSYALSQYSALLVQILKRYGNDLTTATKIIKEAIEPIENLITDRSTSRARPNDATWLVDEAVLHQRLCRCITELSDAADMICDIETEATYQLSKRFEQLHLLMSVSEDKAKTSRAVEQMSCTCGSLLHLTLLSLTKMSVGRFIPRELREEQLRVLPKLMKAIGCGTFFELLWSFGWDACLSSSELLHELILLIDFVVSSHETSSDQMAGAVCSLVIESASAIACPPVCGVFFAVITNLGIRVEQQIVSTVSSLTERRIPEWPYYVLFRMARSPIATLSNSLNLTVAGYQRLWAYCHSGFDLFVLLKDQELEHSLVADLHNLAYMTVSIDGIQTFVGAGSTTETILRLLMDVWIDPFVSFNIVIEMARVYSLPQQLFYSVKDSQSPRCFPDPADCLKTLMDKVPQSLCVIERCKREFLSLITGQGISVNSTESSKQMQDLFRQQVMVSDLVCLDVILEACSDPDITMLEVCLQCRTYWCLHGTDIVDEYNRRKLRRVSSGTTLFSQARDSRQFYYSRILEGDSIQQEQLFVTDVLGFVSNSS